jgi:hypothetical protein
MLDHIKKEHVEVAPPEEDSREMFYLPHHAVKKERLGTTKWRIIFDGSSHENNAPSLNDSRNIITISTVPCCLDWRHQPGILAISITSKTQGSYKVHVV